MSVSFFLQKMSDLSIIRCSSRE